MTAPRWFIGLVRALGGYPALGFFGVLGLALTVYALSGEDPDAWFIESHTPEEVAEFIGEDPFGLDTGDLGDLCTPFGGDTDGDGVCDDSDICADGDDTVDTDGDGTPDACDVCPDFDDMIDSDGDGIPDGCDTPGDTGAPIDTAPPVDSGIDCGGTDTDTDGDGVFDLCDICEDGDDMIDTDGDGTPDDCDLCPETADDGTDSDEDSIPDACDACPDFDDLLDADEDTVPDDCDLCPDEDDTIDLDLDGAPDCATDFPGDTAPPMDTGAPVDTGDAPDPDACARFGGDSDEDGVCDRDDICPGFDDAIDEDGNGIPDGCDEPLDTAPPMDTGDAPDPDPVDTGDSPDPVDTGIAPCSEDELVTLYADEDGDGVGSYAKPSMFCPDDDTSGYVSHDVTGWGGVPDGVPEFDCDDANPADAWMPEDGTYCMDNQCARAWAPTTNVEWSTYADPSVPRSIWTIVVEQVCLVDADPSVGESFTINCVDALPAATMAANANTKYGSEPDWVDLDASDLDRDGDGFADLRMDVVDWDLLCPE